jgi:hypothetical protein
VASEYSTFEIRCRCPALNFHRRGDWLAGTSTKGLAFSVDVDGCKGVVLGPGVLWSGLSTS